MCVCVCVWGGGGDAKLTCMRCASFSRRPAHLRCTKPRNQERPRRTPSRERRHKATATRARHDSLPSHTTHKPGRCPSTGLARRRLSQQHIHTAAHPHSSTSTQQHIHTAAHPHSSSGLHIRATALTAPRSCLGARAGTRCWPAPPKPRARACQARTPHHSTLTLRPRSRRSPPPVQQAAAAVPLLPAAVRPTPSPRQQARARRRRRRRRRCTRPRARA